MIGKINKAKCILIFKFNIEQPFIFHILKYFKLFRLILKEFAQCFITKLSKSIHIKNIINGNNI